MSVRTRFAPSPTGFLHLGNARTALFNWLYTRHEGGTFVLRLEDTDRSRSTEEFALGIERELRWLGLDWDEGVSRGGDRGPYRQSERRERYRIAYRRLIDQGDAYPCFCSEARLEEERESDRRAGRMPRYSGRCRGIPREEAETRLASGEPATGRFRIPEGRVVFEDRIRGTVEVDASALGDLVLVRSDGWPTYNFAVVVDDIEMAISDVIRGEDHLSNTPKQVLLYRALGATPPRFAHLPLVLGSDGSPLSKRHGDTSLRQFYEQGYLPEAVFNYLALLGWSPPGGAEVLGPPEMVASFDLRRVGHSAGVFDRVKLDWIANQHLRRTDSRRLADLAAPFFAASGLLPPDPDEPTRVWLGHLMDLLKESLSAVASAPRTEAAEILFRFEPGALLEDPAQAAEIGAPASRQVLQAFSRVLNPEVRLDRETFRSLAGEAGRLSGARGRDLYHPLRLALTGRGSGPELARIVPLIEEAALLGLPRPVPSCAQRVRQITVLLDGAIP